MRGCPEFRCFGATVIELYLSFSSNSKEIVLVPNQCLVPVIKQISKNKLKVNQNKTEIILVCQKTDQRIWVHIVPDGDAVPLRTHVRSLATPLSLDAYWCPEVHLHS